MNESVLIAHETRKWSLDRILDPSFIPSINTVIVDEHTGGILIRSRVFGLRTQWSSSWSPREPRLHSFSGISLNHSTFHFISRAAVVGVFRPTIPSPPIHMDHFLPRLDNSIIFLSLR